MRIRVCFVAIISLLIWLTHFLKYEAEIFTARAHSYAYRTAELVLCVGIVAYLSRKRTLAQTEWSAAFAFSGLVLAHALALLVVRDDCVVPMTLTMEWGQMVIALSALLSFWPTATLLGSTWVLGTLSTAYRSQWDTDFSDHLVLLVIYAVVLASVRAFDRLRRREFVARERLDLANSELRKAEQARSWLFVNLSHDFRTPLALIHAEAELLERETSAGQRAQGLARVRNNAAQLAELTNELLELSRLEAGKTPVEPENFDLLPVARQIAAQFQGPHQSRTLRVEADDPQVGVFADPGHVRRILTNVVGNATRAAHNEIILRLGCDAHGTWLEVIDDGPGVPTSRRQAIFERFTSFDKAGSVAAGIGLPVARELAELNHGSLELLSDRGQTTFRIRFPKATGPFSTARSETPSAPVLREEFAYRKEFAPQPASEPTRTLLIIEDHPDMRRLLGELLQPYFQLRSAASYKEAERALASDPPSAILCDVMLPDGDGYSILELIRGLRQFDGVPLLFLSALADTEQRTRGLRAGADDYVTKPFSAEELVARVHSACARAEERRRALENQRQDFLAELHDGVTASLSRAALLLSAARNKQEREELIEQALTAVSEGLSEARTILSLIDSGTLSLEAAADTIRDEFETGAESFAIDCSFHFETDGSIPLLSAVESHALRRAAREAVTNAVKHAKPSRLEAWLTVRAGRVLLRVEDDGSGSSTQSAGAGRGLGILKRRVARLKGNVEFGDNPRAGRYIEVAFEPSMITRMSDPTSTARARERADAPLKQSSVMLQ